MNSYYCCKQPKKGKKNEKKAADYWIFKRIEMPSGGKKSMRSILIVNNATYLILSGWITSLRNDRTILFLFPVAAWRYQILIAYWKSQQYVAFNSIVCLHSNDVCWKIATKLIFQWLISHVQFATLIESDWRNRQCNPAYLQTNA